MPRFDGTGPVGRGPMTGWGRGDCIVPLRQMGSYFGRGVRRGWRFAADLPESTLREEIASLQAQMAELRKTLQQR